MGTTVPLDPVPNQSLTMRLDGRRYVITVRDIGDMMAVTIERDGVLLVQNVRACGGTPVLPYSVLSGAAGNFIFTNTVPGEIPFYPAFGSACFLVYSTAAEIAAAVNG